MMSFQIESESARAHGESNFAHPPFVGRGRAKKRQRTREKPKNLRKKCQRGIFSSGGQNFIISTGFWVACGASFVHKKSKGSAKNERNYIYIYTMMMTTMTTTATTTSTPSAFASNKNASSSFSGGTFCDEKSAAAPFRNVLTVPLPSLSGETQNSSRTTRV